MRIPVNWLNEYVKLPGSLHDLTRQLTAAGHMLDKIDVIDNEKVLDLELRGNRADCYSIVGIAQEVSALFSYPVKLPGLYSNSKQVKKLKGINLRVLTPFVNRVMMVKISKVSITASPSWLKKRLEQYGIPSLNNIVDLTNYVMVETGQPMHAFDLDKLDPNLEIRIAKKGEEMLTFQDKKIVLTDSDLVWAMGDQILSVAGAIGGKLHSITGSSTNILVEAASYNQGNIRKTIYRHNLLTEAGIRHEKMLDPNLVETGILRFCNLLEKHGWGKVEPGVFNYYPKPVKPWRINLDLEYLEKLSGVKIDKSEIKNILSRLNLKFINQSGNSQMYICPTIRTDVRLEEDLIEEVLRIYGYDRIPTTTLKLEIPAMITPSYMRQESKVKDTLISLGFNEIISSSFVNEKNQNLNKNQMNPGVVKIKIQNAPSPDIQNLRCSLFPNLYEHSQKIINERGSEVRLFEVGKVYYKSINKLFEKRYAGLIFWKKEKINYRHFKGIMDAIFNKLNISDIDFRAAYDDMFSQSFEIFLGKQLFGLGGNYNGAYFIEFDLDYLLGKEAEQRVNLWPKNPPQINDITLSFPPKTGIGEIIKFIKNFDSLINEVKLIDTFGSSYTFRIHYQHPSRTLNNSEIELLNKSLLEKIKSKYGGRVT